MLVPNIIEVKTPPPPMYEEEMEEQKRLEAQPKYNKELYADSSSSSLSAIDSQDEGDSGDEKQGAKKSKDADGGNRKKRRRRRKHHHKQAEEDSKPVSGSHHSQPPPVSHSHEKSKELRLPDISASKQHHVGTKHTEKATGSKQQQQRQSRALVQIESKRSKMPTSSAGIGGERLTVHSIRGLASELIVGGGERKV